MARGPNLDRLPCPIDNSSHLYYISYMSTMPPALEQSPSKIVLVPEPIRFPALANNYYRFAAMYHRAMMVAFFYDEEKFFHHAHAMQEYISWGTLGERAK